MPDRLTTAAEGAEPRADERILDATLAVLARDGVRVFHVSRMKGVEAMDGRVIPVPLDAGPGAIETCFRDLFGMGVGHILAEGGATLQNLLIEARLWDEAWIIRTATSLPDGIPAPRVTGRLIGSFRSGQDTIIGIKRP